MHVSDLPLVADLGAEGDVRWFEPDGTLVLVHHGGLPDRTLRADRSRDNPNQAPYIRAADAWWPISLAACS